MRSSNIGPVASIRVCRDAVSRRSLGYAYVNFVAPADADRAIEALNFSEIKGRSCRIMTSQRDPSQRKLGKGNVFVHNLDKSINHRQLHDTFEVYGKISSCKVQNKDGSSLGYGFVQFDRDEDALKAIEKVNGMVILGQTVKVELFKPFAERESKKSSFTNVYVKNLPQSYGAEQLTALFAKIGEVANVHVVVDQEGKPKGFGFVNFVNGEDALRATQELHDTDLEDKKLWVGRAQKKNERERELRERFEKIKREKAAAYIPGTNLYVKNLADDVTDEVLRAEFGRFGDITSAKVMHDRENAARSRGFGFVCFSAVDAATKAVTELNSKMLNGKPLYVALAQRRDQRRAQLEAQFARPQFAGGMPYNMGPMGGAQMGFPAAPQMFYPPQAGMRGMPQQMMMPFAQGQPQGQQGAPRMGGQGMRAPYQQQQFQQQQMAYMQTPQGMQQVPQSMRPQVQQGAQGGRAARPPQQQQPPQQLQQGVVAPRAAVPSGVEQLSPEALAAASPENQKQIIGERLFTQISLTQPEQAAKITGMLLEMDNSELLHLLESPPQLAEKVNEALRVLKEHGGA